MIYYKRRWGLIELRDNRRIRQIQQDAISRSQENFSRPSISPAPMLVDKKRAETHQSEDKLKKMLDDIIDGSLDADKLLIAALLILMLHEGADIKLILALGYILI